MVKELNFDAPGIPNPGYALTALTAACDSTGASFFLFGALARDILMHHLRNVEWSPRMTRDVDVAVRVKDWKHYESLTDQLVRKHGFQNTRWIHRFKAPNSHLNVDLIPFGGVEDDEHHINWPNDNHGRISVLGFHEAHELAERTILEEIEVRIIALQAYGPIKLLAWKDRQHLTSRDAEDFGFVIVHFWEAETELILEAHADLFETEDGDNNLIGARAYGRESAFFVSRSLPLRKKLMSMLERETADIQTSQLAVEMGRECHRDYDRRFRCLARYYEGLREKLDEVVSPRPSIP